jgi:hypothetical protein
VEWGPLRSPWELLSDRPVIDPLIIRGVGTLAVALGITVR